MSKFGHLDKAETRSRTTLNQADYLDASLESETSPVDEKLSPVHPRDFITFVPWACNVFGLNIIVNITRDVLEPYIYGSHRRTTKSTHTVKSVRTLRGATHPPDQKQEEKEVKEKFEIPPAFADLIVNIKAKYDNDSLVFLHIAPAKKLPREFFAVIGLTLKYHPNLNGITIRGGIDQYSCYELSKFLDVSKITELCLDDAFVKEANYYLLLEQPSNLAVLSLARCKLGDEALKAICETLKHPLPASATLVSLNVSSNRITDNGAQYIAEFLSSNRKLAHINLASNLLTDDGAITILSSLKESSVTYREKFVKEMMSQLRKQPLKEARPSLIKKVANAKRSKLKAKYSSTRIPSQSVNRLSLMKLTKSPRLKERMTIDSKAYSPVNNTLCSINFSYNQLTLIALSKMIEVLKYQISGNRVPNGLINIRIEGCYLPEGCVELTQLDNLLDIQMNNKSLSIQQNLH